MKIIEEFFALFFPNLCITCGNSLWKNENVVCTRCDFHLPRTNFHVDYYNPIMDIFAGRIRLAGASASFYFNKGSHLQLLIHQLKYKGRKDVGFWLGQKTGKEIKNSAFIYDVDLIIPVPLHLRKKLQRGYNQSEEFAKGISDKTNIPLNTTILIRPIATETQTRKSRFNRWENVSGIFKLTDMVLLAGKHILLVDDVITTGSTIEACFLELSKTPGIRISVIAIAAAIR